MVAPELEKLVAKYGDQIAVVKVDVDANPALAQAFNVMSIPTIALFQPGEQPKGVTGYRSLDQLETRVRTTAARGREQLACGPRTRRIRPAAR